MLNSDIYCILEFLVTNVNCRDKWAGSMWSYANENQKYDILKHHNIYLIRNIILVVSVTKMCAFVPNLDWSI